MSLGAGSIMGSTSDRPGGAFPGCDQEREDGSGSQPRSTAFNPEESQVG